MNPPANTIRALAVALSAFVLLACNALVPATLPAEMPALPTVPVALTVSLDTPTPSISEQVTLTAIPFSESDPGSGYPKYEITAQIPQLAGSDDLNVLAFNQRINEIVTDQIDSWRQEFKRLPLTPLSNGSSLSVTYTLAGQTADLWSFKFDFAFYADTAAHPGLNITTFNYNLAQGRELTLNDLFLPNTAYLDAISAYCIAELQKQPFADSFWLDGASPKPENYQLWNITPEGLMITFGQYQVAPYAAGPQTVVVPYEALASLIDPAGPLGLFLP